MPLSPVSPWWERGRYQDRRGHLLRRQRLLKGVRSFFEAKGFLEVECPQIQVSPGNETHLHALAVHPVDGEGVVRTRYLATSPEFSCKKILAAGEEKIFTLARVFRDRERGPLHGLEFTLLEWYRARVPYGVLMEDVLGLLRAVAGEAEGGVFSYRGHRCDPLCEPERITVQEAFMRYGEIDLLSTISGPFSTDRDALCRAIMARHRGFCIEESDDWSDLFSKALTTFVEPHLGHERFTILDQYPKVLSALARPHGEDGRVAERFEVYVCGVELANGFGECTDPDLQRACLEAEMDEKARRYGVRYPLDDDFLAALCVMPEASGIALGFDRLAVLASHARTLEEVSFMPMTS